MSALVTSEIFRLFVNTLTPDDKYSTGNMQIFWKQLQTLLSQEEKTFRGFFIAFQKCAWNLEYSVRKEEYQRVNGFETLLKSARHSYFPLFPQLPDKLNWKKSALVTTEIFRLFVNTLTPDDKYSRRNMQIFWQQLETPLSQKGKTFWTLLFVNLKSPWNLEHSEKKEQYPSLIIT